MNLKHTTKAQLAKDLNAYRKTLIETNAYVERVVEERNEFRGQVGPLQTVLIATQKDLEVSRRAFAAQAEENRKLMKEIGEFNGRLDALDKAIDSKNVIIHELNLQVANYSRQLANYAEEAGKRIRDAIKSTEQIYDKNITIRELCRIVSEGK